MTRTKKSAQRKHQTDGRRAKKPQNICVVYQGSTYAVQEMRPLTSEDLTVALPGIISGLGYKNNNNKAYQRGLKVAVCSNGEVFRAPIKTIKRSLGRLECLPQNPALYTWSKYQS